MPDIELHFTEYFDGETVVVSSEGRELSRAEGLRTDVRTGSARIIRIKVPDKHSELTFKVLPKGTEANLVVDPSTLKFVTAALKDGQLELNALTVAAYAREPRGYA